MNKKLLIIIISAILIGSIVVISNPSLVNLAPQVAPTTVTTQVKLKGTHWNDDRSEGTTLNKVTVEGYPAHEITPVGDYVTAWYPNSLKSEKILLTGAIKFWEQGHTGLLEGGRPTVLLNDYYWKVKYYNDAGTLIATIIDKNIIKSDYVAYADDSAQKSTAPQVFTPGSGFTTGSSKYLTGESGWMAYTSTPSTGAKIESYQAYPAKILTKTLALQLKGPLDGYLKAELYVRWADYDTYWEGISYNFAYYNMGYNLVQYDYLNIHSGAGSVDTASTNSIRTDGGYYADGTNEYETKYVFKEGQTVKFNVQLGAAGVTSDTISDTDKTKQWRLELINPNGQTFTDSNFPKYFTTEQTETIVSWTIPIGSFNKYGTGNNQWKIKLYNGLVEQSETQIFVVDELNVLPSKSSITQPGAGASFTLGQVVTVKCSASPNPSTNSPIDHFSGWAKYLSTTSTSYAFSSSNIDAVNGIGTFTFTPDRVGNVYIMAWAVDEAGRTGGESDVKIITVASVPKVTIYIKVLDDKGIVVQGATVKFGASTQASNAEGIATFNVDPSQYALLVTKTNYESYANTYSIASTDNYREIKATIKSTTGPIDEDMDDDTIPDATDNCPTTYNPGQEDIDGDGIGDVCDTDETPDEGEEFTLTFTVFTELGSPVSQASIAIASNTAYTDINGVATIKALSGIQTVTVNAIGFITYTNAVTISGEGQTESVILTQGGNYQGDCAVTITVLSTKDQSAIVNADVVLGTASGKTDTTGNVILTVPAGDMNLKITVMGYVTYDELYTIGGPCDYTIALTPGENIAPTPGFELLGLIIAIGIVAIILKRKKVKQ